MKTAFWKILLALFPLIVIGTATLYLSGVFGTRIPDFVCERLDGRTFTPRENLRPDIPVVLVYLDVMCDDCQKLVQDITAHRSDFEKSQVLLISPQGWPQLKGFNKNFNLAEHRYIVLLQDRFQNIDHVIKTQSFPTVLVFNKNQKLVRRFDKVPEINELIASLKD